MELGIQGKTALVLSAGGGLGSAVALALAREGVAVCMADIHRESLATAAARVRGAGGTAHEFAWDLASAAQTQQALQQVLTTVGGVDILFNNTGGPPPGPAFGHAHSTWSAAFEAMVLSVVGITDALLPGMRARHWGRVITSTSSGVVAPIANLALSNATRTALLGWSKSLAMDVAADGVTVNVMVPGRIATARTRFLDTARAEREQRDVDSVAAQSAAAIPARRYGRPEEYADVAAFLASERASYITGATVRVDGGLIASL